MFRPVSYGRKCFKFFEARRLISSNVLRVSEEIKDALASRKPVVALESTIVTHGLPFPKNVEMANEVEKTIRENGAVPATIAFLRGRPCIGFSTAEIQYLAEQLDAIKVSRRDIAHVMVNKLNGGTTISGTMILAEKAGIRVFGTGGLGGCHKGSDSTFDISADLTELGRTKVAVVCAGPKSILDIDKTMEYLETQGCYVATYGEPGTNVPGFFAVDSGVASPYNFQDYLSAASVIYQGASVLGLSSGYLFCIPPGQDYALDSLYISGIIAEAEAEALRMGIKGKKLTPYLLGKIASITKGTSVDTNIKTVLNNVTAASKIAVELSKLEVLAVDLPYLETPSPELPSPELAVVGAVAVDLMCQLIPELFHAGDSNPGTSSSSIGGVALNVATAAKYAGANVKLISQIGKDSFGKFVVAQLKAKGIATSGISESSTHNTAKYVSVHENSGDLIVACAEMDIAEHFDTSVISELEATRPKVVVADSNVSAQILAEIITKAAELDAAVVYEPTSSVKAERIAEAILIEPANFTQHLSHFFSGSRPSGLVLATPTASELTTIHDALESRGLFDVDVWFPVLDSLGINSQFRNQLDSLGLPVFKYAIKEGILQKAFKLLPYIPSLVIKLGDKGLFVVNISVITNQLVRRTKASRDSALSSGPLIDGIRLGVCVEYFKIPKSIRIKNVTGAGDTLVGVLAQETLRHGTDWLFNSGDRRTKILQRAQLAAGESLQSQESVSINIKNI